MKRVLHISKYYYPFRGGTEQTARDCVKALLGSYEQKVICFNDSKDDSTDYIDDIEVIRVGCFTKIASQSISTSYGKMLKEIIKEYKPDIIIFHYPNPFVAYYLLKYIPPSTRLAIYWHLDIVKQKILKQFFVGQNKQLIKRANLLIATSPIYVDGSPYLSSVREKCAIVSSCINENLLTITDEIALRAEQITTENKDKTILLAVGRHTEYKGFKYLIQASRLLDDNFEIFITGKGEETDNLKKEAAGDKKVHFLGLVDDKELKAYMMAMDIFCFPSITKNEAFGLALAEGMYFGKPAVTFAISGSGVNYVNLNGITGIEVPNRDVSAYAEAIKKLARDKELRTRMGEAGRKRVQENFLIDSFSRNILSAIDTL